MNSGPTRTRTGTPQYAAARTRLFGLKAKDIGIAAPPRGPDVWGIVIDYPTDVTTCTLVTLADGTVNLWLSDGPTFLGAGQHPEVARAAELVLSDAQTLHSILKPAADFSLPSNDRACIYLLASSGVLREEVSDDESSETQSRLAELSLKGDAVITAIRKCCEPQQSRSPRFNTKDNYLQAKIVALSLALGACVGAVTAQVRLPGVPSWAGALMGGLFGLIVGFLGSGLLLLVIDVKRRKAENRGRG